MKAKTIRKILAGKFHVWKETITDMEVKKLVEEGTMITGGCITSFLLDEEVNDFDIYFRNKATALAVANYYVGKFKESNPSMKFKNSDRSVQDMVVKDCDGRIKIFIKSVGMASESKGDEYQYFETIDPGSPEQQEFIEEAVRALKASSEAKKGEYKPIFITSNSIMLSSSVQLIFRFYGEPEDIHSNYDFVHCTNYWTSWEGKLVLNKDALESILTKELQYCGSKYPLCSIIRTRKFVKKGWSVNAGQFLKMAMQLNDLDLKNVRVLEDQLIGVDVAYFMDLISRVRSGSRPVDTAYISELVDEIF